VRLRRLDGIVIAAGLATAILLATDVWPGVRGPANWQWQRRVLGSPAPLLGIAAVFGLTVWLAARIRSEWGRALNTLRLPLLAAAILVIFAQMLLLTAAEPGGLSNVPRRVMDPSFTSYHTIAREVSDPVDFLRRYHHLQPRFGFVHGPSQPPGRVLFFWAVNRWASEPGRTRVLLALGESLGGIPSGPPGTTDAERAGALLAGYLLIAVGALALVPLVVLVGGRCDPGAVGASILLFASLPSFLLFTPETDHLLLLLSLTAAVFAVEAVRHASSKWSPALAFGAGIAASIGAFVSFTVLAGIAAWGVALAGMVLFARFRGEMLMRSGRFLLLATAALLGFAAVPMVTSALGMNWPAVFREATEAAYRVQVQIHGREYSTWVLWNLWDFALFLGPPLVVAWLSRIAVELPAVLHRRGAVGLSAIPIEVPFALALVISVLALDLSGKILGETGRIWMFLMPLAVAAGASAYRDRPLLEILPLAGAQLLVLLAMRMFLNVPG
jgi:hypothetical protein